jgi:peptidyl-prolyl cis-trans isomerase D
MIRFLQTPGPIKKIVLGGLLTVVCVLMAITLIPGFGSSSFLTNASSPNVVATVSGEEITVNEVEHQAKAMLNQQFPRGGAQASSLLPFFAQRAAENLINEKLLVVEAQRLGLKATDDDLRAYLHQGQLGEMLLLESRSTKISSLATATPSRSLKLWSSKTFWSRNCATS